MYKKGENIVITKCSTPKLPNVKDSGGFRMSVIRGAAMFSHERPVKTHILPGIGTFVIDTPKDKDLSARQRCFRYQEAHRGVVRSKAKAFPDIPKRCDMKNLPIVQLRDLNAKTSDNTTPTRQSSPAEGQNPSVSPVLTDGGISCQSPEGIRHEKSQKQETALKIQSQDVSVSRSPAGRTVQISGEHRGAGSPVMVNGFGVRRGKSVAATMPGTSSRREFTNLTKNLLLAEPESTPCKATERELESQAEYRKQLTFYLSQMFEAEQDQPKKPWKEDADDDDSANNVLDENIHVDNIGHTSKHQEWESSISLGEMLINTTPDLRKRLRLDFKIRETGSGKSNSMTPEVDKHSGKHLAPRDLDIVNDKTCRNNNSYNNGSQHNSIRGSHDVRADMARSSPQKSPLPPKRRPTCPNSQNGIIKEYSYGGFEKEKKKGRSTDMDNKDEGKGGDLNIQHGASRLEDDEENEESEEEDEVDQYDDIVDEKWLHMVNTPVVESWGYDRYANVKLPPSLLQRQPYNLHKRSSPVKNGIYSTSANRALPGACSIPGGGSTSLSDVPGKGVTFTERKTVGRVT